MTIPLPGRSACRRLVWLLLPLQLMALAALAAPLPPAVKDEALLKRDFSFRQDIQGHLLMDAAREVYAGRFAPGADWQSITFSEPVITRYFCLEALSSQDGRPFAAAAEIDLLDADGKSIPHDQWQVAYVDSEESDREKDWAENIFDDQPDTYWHTQWSKSPPGFPHRLIIDLGAPVTLGGFRFLPRQGDATVAGRIQDYQIFTATSFIREKPDPNQLPEKIFLFSYFTSYGDDGLHLAWSRDGYSWEPLNRGRSFLPPGITSSNMIRDPCIVQGSDGVFRVVWTGNWVGDSIGYSASKDLIHWTTPRAIPVMAGQTNTHNCWAPEIYWDAQRTNYLIIWASAVAGQFPETEAQNAPNDNQRLYFTTTRDFQTFTPTHLFLDPGLSLIDPVIVPAGDRHYLIFKDETSHPTAQNLRVARGTGLYGPYQLLGGAFSPDFAEGPVAFFDGHDYLCLYHLFTSDTWGAMRTSDFAHWTDVSERLNMPLNAHSGTIIQIPRNYLIDLWRTGKAEIGPDPQTADLGLGSWIWTDTVADKQPCRLWRTFIIPPGTLVSRAVLRITADNGYRVFLDGREVGRGGDYNDLTEYDVTQLIGPGTHVLAVEGFNDALAAGVIAGLNVEMLSGQKLELLSDAAWKVVPMDEKKWTTRREPGPDWKPATIVGFAGKFDWQRPKRILSSPPLLPQQIFFWQRGWFLATVLSLSALVIIFSIRQGLKLAVHNRSNKLLDRERARIARDMHDDLGSGLTQLTLLGELLMRDAAAAGESQTRLTELCAKARSLLRLMDEIVWTVNPRRDTVKDFAAFISEHAQEYLTSTAIRCRQEMAEELPDIPLDLPQRRNLLLAVKEAIRNAARHSGADEVHLSLRVVDGSLEVVIEDNGKGFMPTDTQINRNGLVNMKHRLADIGGSFNLKAAPGKGCRIAFLVPLPRQD